MAFEEILTKLKERDIMAAVVSIEGTVISSNFQLGEGVDAYSASAFNVGDALLHEAGERATDLVITADTGNIILKKVEGGFLVALIKNKDQYEFYKQAVGEKA